MQVANAERQVFDGEKRKIASSRQASIDVSTEQAVEASSMIRSDLQSARAYSGNSPATGKAAAPRWTFPTDILRSLSRRFATLVISLIAVIVSIVVWDQYVTSPWTRDGRVRVQVASVSPQVSGQIIKLRIVDNQFVHKGDVLYEIDPFDFDVTLRTNIALLHQHQTDLRVKELQSERRQRLSDLSVTQEEQQVYDGNALQARAQVEAAQQQVAQADLDLKRTEIRSPVNGYVTNLLMRQGDYAHTGVSNVSIIDTDSFWVDGYFEETKLATICVGDRAEVTLMGYAKPIIGHVTTVTRGVSVSNATAGAQGLPNVEPVYAWVRLAQRVPVRIAIDDVPPGVPLVSGMTGTVAIRSISELDSRSWFERGASLIRSSVSHLINGVTPRVGCIPERP